MPKCVGVAPRSLDVGDAPASRYVLEPIFLHKKHENQPQNQKVVLLVAPFF
jgi:hypothetical protein